MAYSQVYGWGSNEQGQLGLKESKIPSPQKLFPGQKIKATACSFQATYILDGGSSLKILGNGPKSNVSEQEALIKKGLYDKWLQSSLATKPVFSSRAMQSFNDVAIHSFFSSPKNCNTGEEAQIQTGIAIKL